MVFNPLKHLMESTSTDEQNESTSSLDHDHVNICPKCKQPFGPATVNGDSIYYCVNCRVSQPIPE